MKRTVSLKARNYRFAPAPSSTSVRRRKLRRTSSRRRWLTPKLRGAITLSSGLRLTRFLRRWNRLDEIYTFMAMGIRKKFENYGPRFAKKRVRPVRKNRCFWPVPECCERYIFLSLLLSHRININLRKKTPKFMDSVFFDRFKNLTTRSHYMLRKIIRTIHELVHAQIQLGNILERKKQ